MRPHRQSVQEDEHRITSRKKRLKKDQHDKKGWFILIDSGRMYRSSFVVGSYG
jgi:hypothetical protein